MNEYEMFIPQILNMWEPQELQSERENDSKITNDYTRRRREDYSTD